MIILRTSRPTSYYFRAAAIVAAVTAVLAVCMVSW